MAEILSEDKKHLTASEVVLNYSAVNTAVPGTMVELFKGFQRGFFDKVFNSRGDDIMISDIDAMVTPDGVYKNPIKTSSAENLAAWNRVWGQYGARTGITSPVGYAILMGQILHESGNFRYMKEQGGPKYLSRYEGRRDLGNTQPGDGIRFAGRGPIQVTGRANYTAIYENFFKTIGKTNLDIVSHPELGDDPEVASLMTIGWLMVTPNGKKLRNICTGFSKGDSLQNIVIAATRAVNGGTNGLQSRYDWTLELVGQYQTTGKITIV